MMEGQNYFNQTALPVCLTMLGDNIGFLRHQGVRDVINSKLRDVQHGSPYVKFDVDEYDQIVAAFYRGEDMVTEKYTIRANTLNMMIDIINKMYIINFSTNNKNIIKMKKSVKKTTNVANENRTESSDIKVLVDLILQHYAGAGPLFELEEIGALNVQKLCTRKTNGTVIDIKFDGNSLTVYGAGDNKQTCNVLDTDGNDRIQTKAILVLQSVINFSIKMCEVNDLQSMNSTTSVELPSGTAVVPRDDKKFSMTPIKKNCKKALNKYNDLVTKGVSALEQELKGHSQWSCGQRIHNYLSRNARAARVHTESTSTKMLVSHLTDDNKELIRTLYVCLEHNVPSCLRQKPEGHSSDSKMQMKG